LGQRSQAERPPSVRTTEAIEAIIAADHQDPLLTLAELQAKSSDEGIRATAANMLAPFLHSKCGAMPPLRFISEPIELPYPNPTTLEEINAKHFLPRSSSCCWTLDIDFHTALLAGRRQHIESIKARGDDNLDARSASRTILNTYGTEGQRFCRAASGSDAMIAKNTAHSGSIGTELK
jgi:hypothetical protein